MTRYIFVTGGVVSSLGKGIASASLGALLEARGLKVTLIKLDPYINVDPGTMSPFQHGEVYVTEDGTETDLISGITSASCARAWASATTTPPAASIGTSFARNAARSSRGDRSGHPAYYRRDQGLYPQRRRGRGRRHGGNRRHGRRHRVPSLPRGHPPISHRARAEANLIHSPDLGSLHRLGGRDQDQADTTFRQGIALYRYTTRYSALPRGPAAPARRAQEDRALTNVEERAVISAIDVDNIYKIPLIFHEQGLDAIVVIDWRSRSRTPICASGRASSMRWSIRSPRSTWQWSGST